MIYRKFQDLKLSALGFGTMRLPVTGADPAGGQIDQAEVDRMVEAAMDAGVNYYDTAYPYHAGRSENSIGDSLKRYPRDSWYLADKFPGHQNVSGKIFFHPEKIFEEQLKKCKVDYFDFYLLHNINENSLSSYYDAEAEKCIDYLLKQKAAGRIRHLGFSCHSAPDALQRFLSTYGKYMEFCQIQLNYMDWTLQDARKKCEILQDFKLPVFVMEPIRGGKLAHFKPEIEAKMKALHPNESIAAWALRWLQTVPDPKPTMVLSGMSNLNQMQDNLKTYFEEKPLSREEVQLLEEAADSLAQLIPCTECRYCCKGCPVELDIPVLMNMANEMRLGSSINTIMRYTALGEGKRADSCIHCGQCKEACPQKISVPEEMEKLSTLMSAQKSWEEICMERIAKSKAL